METRAVEESFSWKPRSRKTFVREVPLLSRGRRKTEKTGREGGRRGEGGGGGGWGGRGGEGGRGAGPDFGAPPHKQPESIGGGETSPPDLGARLWVHTEGPPPPSRGGQRGGDKRRGIEESEIGTSDRFGRGRSEFSKHLLMFRICFFVFKCSERLFLRTEQSYTSQ